MTTNDKLPLIVDKNVFSKQVKQKIEPEESSEAISPDEMWTRFRNVVRASNTNPQRPKVHVKHQEWITDGTLKLRRKERY